MVRETKRDASWRQMFAEYRLLDDISRESFADVSSTQFHQLGFEPRLMTKMDHATQIPSIFEENQLNIIARGIDTWRIGSFDVFINLPDQPPSTPSTATLAVPSHLETIDVSNISGEAGAINAALLSGMLDDFCGEGQKLTVSGRMRTPDFSFILPDRTSGMHTICVSKAQIEIDAGFENEESFSLFEVKNHMCADFCLRQLYYPLRTWMDRVRGKPLRTVFLRFANDIYDLYEIWFTDPHRYSSAEISRHKRYSLSSSHPTVSEVRTLCDKSLVKNCHIVNNVPFPQADDFERVMDLVSFLSEGARTVDDLAVNYDFHPRQSDYYFNAARYLGLGETIVGADGSEQRQVTSLAQEILGLPYRERILRYAELVLAIRPMAETFRMWCTVGSRPSLDWIANTFSSSPYAVGSSGESLAHSTIRRRSQTIAAWSSWLWGIGR